MSERGLEISQHIPTVERLAVTEHVIYSTPESVKEFAFQCYKMGDGEVLGQLIDGLTERSLATDDDDGLAAIEEAHAVLEYALGVQQFLEQELAQLNDSWDEPFPQRQA